MGRSPKARSVRCWIIRLPPTRTEQYPIPRRLASSKSGVEPPHSRAPTSMPPATAPDPAAPPTPRRAAPTQNRAHLAEWAARFRHALAVEAAVLMRINQIVEDSNRPLGEAVALLPPRAFEPLKRE